MGKKELFDPLMKGSYAAKISILGQTRAKETDPARIAKLDEALLFLKMKAIHTSFVYDEGMGIYKSLGEAAKTNPSALAMANGLGNLVGLTNKQAFEIATKHFADYEHALVGHDVGRAYEHDNQGNPNYKLHPHLSFENTEHLSDVARVAILNHTYPSQKDMVEKVNSIESAGNAKDSHGHAEWMSSVQVDAHKRYQAMPQDDKVATMLISNMIRDADKLGNWRGVVAWGQQENTPTMQRVYSAPHGRKGSFTLSEREMGAMRENRVLNYYEDVTNFNGMNLAVLMWAPDFALEVTNKAAAKSNLALGLIDYMDEYAQERAREQQASNDYTEFLGQLGEVFGTMQKRGFIGKESNFGAEKRQATFDRFAAGKLKRAPLALDGIRRNLPETEKTL